MTINYVLSLPLRCRQHEIFWSNVRLADIQEGHENTFFEQTYSSEIIFKHPVFYFSVSMNSILVRNRPKHIKSTFCVIFHPER